MSQLHVTVIALTLMCLGRNTGVLTAPTQKGITMNNGMFALDLYRQLWNRDGNIFFSPISISTAMAMLHLGSDGNTKRQIEYALRFDQGDGIHPLFQSLNNELYATGKNYTLKSANRLFGSQDFTFKQTFLDDAKKFYDSALQELNFKESPEPSRKIINDWVALQTENKIKDLLSPGTINRATAMVLVNAIYFRGFWETQFEPKNTKPDTFYANGVTSKTVDMMSLRGKSFKYGQINSLDSQLIQLPYKDGVSMYILLPNDRMGLPDVEGKLNITNLKEAISSLHKTKVDVWIPKFKLEKMRLDLLKIFNQMGLTDLSSDLSRLGGQPGDLAVSDIVHEAFVEVDEVGTKAAAATAIVIRLTSVFIPEPPKVFRADHPFLFFIRHDATESILFLGRFQDPAN